MKRKDKVTYHWEKSRPRASTGTNSSTTPYTSRETSFEHDEESHPYSDTSSHTTISYAEARPLRRRNHRQYRPQTILRGRRLHHQIMRCVCLAVFFALVLFVFVLFRVTLLQVLVGVSPVDSELLEGGKLPPTWKGFPVLQRYYGGLRTLVRRAQNVPENVGEGQKEGGNTTDAAEDEKKGGFQAESYVFDPYPNYTSPEYLKRFGRKQDCFLTDDDTVKLPPVRYYDGVPRGFPDAAFGSNAVLGLRDDICFERFGRLGPYGLGYGRQAGGSSAGLHGDRAGAEAVWAEVPPVDFRKVKWADAVQRCVQRNEHRFRRVGEGEAGPVDPTGRREKRDGAQDELRNNMTTGSEKLPRTAFLIRTWHDFEYTEETILNLRALIAELTLQSGGEFEVHFLVHVRDDNLPIWADDTTYQRVLRDALPEEFRGLGTLWTERQMGLIYGGLHDSMARGLPVHGVYRSAFMAVQHFSHRHPQYEFVWNWELDVRYSGHWYALVQGLGAWAQAQPRKHLWERSGRFYVPTVHGGWQDFRRRIETEGGYKKGRSGNIKNGYGHDDSEENYHGRWSALLKASGGRASRQQQQQQGQYQQPHTPIWGPLRPGDAADVLQVEGEGTPPTGMAEDHDAWGTGEDADLIVLNPLFDPAGTTWLLRDDVTGYRPGAVPRRAAVITASRLSRRLLHTMHRETSEKRHTMFSEMWPATACLHHGFKAVFAPHAVYLDRHWPAAYLAGVLNGGHGGASGGARSAVFGDGEHHLRGASWFYAAHLAGELWARWLGGKGGDGQGGERDEMAGEGRMCLPPMLLHPVKGVRAA
ncbi:hypothetical protein LOZ66_004071 [Ophidiomyces ophidiicola]|nr:hypothetical protein LOZ66_004071 [Ophidiomyces ophidiicola]